MPHIYILSYPNRNQHFFRMAIDFSLFVIMTVHDYISKIVFLKGFQNIWFKTLSLCEILISFFKAVVV